MSLASTFQIGVVLHRLRHPSLKIAAARHKKLPAEFATSGILLRKALALPWHVGEAVVQA